MRVMMMIVCAAACVLGLVGSARSEEKAFDFKDPKGVNAIGIHLDSLLEPFGGFADGVSGTVRFDPAAPGNISGKLIVEAASITMSNPMMTKVLHSEDWIDVQKNPTVEYAFKGASDVKKSGEATWVMTVTGDFTLCGVTREESVVLSVTYLEGKAADRNHKGEGDLLVLRGNLAVDRTAYGIKPATPPLTVAHQIDLRVGIVGTWLRK